MIHNKFNSISISILVGLKHEEVSNNQIRFVCLLLKILMQIIYDWGHKLYWIYSNHSFLINITKLILNKNHFNFGMGCLKSIFYKGTNHKRNIEMWISALNYLDNLQYRNNMTSKNKRINLNFGSVTLEIFCGIHTISILKIF
jgi:hypothetical protein